MTAPPYECPTRTTGPDCLSITAFVNLTSSANEVSGCCTTDTVYPSFLRILATASQPEPSANAPCTRTTFLMPVCGAGRAAAAFRAPPTSVTATAAIALRFFTILPQCLLSVTFDFIPVLLSCCPFLLITYERPVVHFGSSVPDCSAAM